MREIWKPIPGWEDLYSVSNLGRVRSEARIKRRVARDRWGTLRHYECHMKQRLLKVNIDSGGYAQVVLQRQAAKIKERITVVVHRLVLTAFRRLPTPADHGMHKNDVRSDNRLRNLKWGTRLENSKDMVKKGRRQGGGDGSTQLSKADRAAIAGRPKDKLADLALEFATSKSNVSKIRAKAKYETLQCH